MGRGRARPVQVPIPPLPQAPPVYGPRQVLSGPPTPDEIWEELPPRPPLLGQRRPHNLPQLPECPRDIRACHPPLFSQGACQDSPPSGGPRRRPRRPGLVLGRPPGRPDPLHQFYGYGLPPCMFSRPSSSTGSVSSRSSNVVSFGYFMSSQES